MLPKDCLAQNTEAFFFIMVKTDPTLRSNPACFKQTKQKFS